MPDVLSFDGDYAILSNFAPAVVKFDGLYFPTVENAFQAAKSLTSLGRQEFVKLTPSEAKKLGRRIRLRLDWNDVKDAVMFSLLMQKFRYGTRAYATLMSTGDGHICEGNTWHDNYWGDCSCPRCAAVEGKNMMGKLLTEIRDMPLLEKAFREGTADRWAFILPEPWESELSKNDKLCADIIQGYHVDGILVMHKGPATLYHCASESAADAILSGGFKVGSNPYGNGTFGDDVVYAWEDTHLGLRHPGDVWLAVKVSSYMRASVTVDKDDANQHECIFFPSDVISVERM